MVSIQLSSMLGFGYTYNIPRHDNEQRENRRRESDFDLASRVFVSNIAPLVYNRASHYG